MLLKLDALIPFDGFIFKHIFRHLPAEQSTIDLLNIHKRVCLQRIRVECKEHPVSKASQQL